MSLSIIIPKLNKALYNSLKAFRSIFLLNMLGKLIKKVIGDRLQFQSISKNFIYLCQLDSLKQCSAMDTGIVLIHIIYMGWVESLSTSILVFDIAQFFPSLNHCLLPLILAKAGFDCRILSFFSNYLVDRITSYLCNNFSSPFFNVNIGVR